MNRIVIIISFFVLCHTANCVAQIACPAMGLTQVNVNKNNKLSGFSSAVRNGRKSARMGDFFTSKPGKGNQFRNYDEFSTKRKRGGGFLDKDEFASRSKKKGRFRSYDEFATRSKRSRQFRDFDEFAYSRKTRRVNIDSQFAVRSTEKRFKRGKRQKDEFSSKKKRSRQARSEYTPFASTTSPFAGKKKHRDPQIGLWGGTVGTRSGKDKRPGSALPEVETKQDD